MSLATSLVVLGVMLQMRAGLITFGQGLFYCLGAYVAGMAGYFWGITDVFLLLFAGTAVCVLLSVVLGFLLVRYREIFYAMFSLALSMILYGLLVKAEILGSTDGFHIVPVSYLGFTPSSETSGLALYIFTVIVTVIAAALTARYLESIMGRLSTAIRDNELRVEYLGFSVRRAVHVKFTIAGAVAGAGGAIAAIAVGHVDPEMVWWIASGEFVFVTVLSGAGSVIAPFVGSAVFELLRTLALQFAPNVWQIIVGVTLLAVIMFLPGGLWSVVDRVRNKLR
jgi:branched-chain amino acid transport system permease protein